MSDMKYWAAFAICFFLFFMVPAMCESRKFAKQWLGGFGLLFLVAPTLVMCNFYLRHHWMHKLYQLEMTLEEMYALDERVYIVLTLFGGVLLFTAIWIQYWCLFGWHQWDAPNHTPLGRMKRCDDCGETRYLEMTL